MRFQVLYFKVKEYPQAFMSMNVGNFDSLVALDCYEFVGEIEADTKDAAFVFCQEWPGHRSMSVGDALRVIESNDPKDVQDYLEYFICAPSGWVEVDLT